MRAKFIYEQRMEDILKPKSKEEIRSSIIDLIKNSQNLGNVYEDFIERSDADYVTKLEIEKMCSIMNSDPKNVVYISDVEDNFSSIDTILYNIFVYFKENLSKFQGIETEYQINPLVKIAYTYGTDLMVLFFDVPHILNMLQDKKFDDLWIRPLTK